MYLALVWRQSNPKTGITNDDVIRAHLSQTCQTAYAEPLEILVRKGLITKGTDFYGPLYVLSLNLMRAIPHGREWQDST